MRLLFAFVVGLAATPALAAPIDYTRAAPNAGDFTFFIEDIDGMGTDITVTPITNIGGIESLNVLTRPDNSIFGIEYKIFRSSTDNLVELLFSATNGGQPVTGNFNLGAYDLDFPSEVVAGKTLPSTITLSGNSILRTRVDDNGFGAIGIGPDVPNPTTDLLTAEQSSVALELNYIGLSSFIVTAGNLAEPGAPANQNRGFTFGNIIFSPDAGGTQTIAAPVPMPLPLLLVGIGALALVARRRPAT